ncbi:non-ribosomal peptide synthetase [Oleidesulfovibrio sp.]|uniref:non-ribosomal peptide synthetase n=1 Tax=Oleidesulfovibrio sp. TaxID=2909707 RepID=UPI003A8481DB
MNKQTLVELPLEELLNFARETARNNGNVHIAFGPEGVTVEKAELSFAQERLWFMNRLSPDNPFYNIPFYLEVAGELDRKAFTKAWTELIKRHSCLHSCYPGDETGKPTVTLLLPDNLPLTYNDISHQAHEEQQKHLKCAMNYEGSIGFDMAQGPLLRGVLIRQKKNLHTLLITFHHIIFDGWSVTIFYKELFEIYDTIRKGTPLPLHNSDATYEQYALWQRQRMTLEYIKKEQKWWQTELQDLPELQLWTDAPRPETQTFSGDTIEFFIPGSVATAMENLAQRHNATPFMAWLAVFSLMLSRFSGQVDFAVGCSVAGRNHPATENIIGFFLNNLVVRNRLTDNSPFTQLLENLRDTVLHAMEHEELPFQFLADAVGEGRSLNKNPLYQAGLVYQNTPSLDTLSKELSLHSVLVPMNTTHMDVEFLIWPEKNGLRCYLVFATDIISAQRAKDMVDTLKWIGRIVSDTPSIPIHEILPAEKATILHGQQLQHDYLPFWQQLEKILETDESTTAIFITGESGYKTDSKEISYGDLVREAEQMAARLDQLKLKPGSIVSIMLHPSLEQTAAMLAVWRQGCIWVPLDPDHPASMNQWIMEDSASCCVITHSLLWEEHTKETVSGIMPCLIDCHVETQPAKVGTPPSASAACILYTSGSTGQPKGITLSHEALHTRLSWMWFELPWKTGDVACQKTSPCFVDFLWETFGAILGRTPLVLAGARPYRNIDRLLTVMREHKVTHMVLVPSLLRAMHEVGQGIGETVPSLRVILSSGEVLCPELCQKTRNALPDIRLFNLYGSTEVMDAIWHEASAKDRKAVPVGKPVHNTTVAILDDALRPVPTGEKGTLYVCGPCVAHGYHGKASKKNAMFIPPEIPGIETPQGRWFCMGDEAALGQDGLIYYHGRKDRQIKVRGVRMEPDGIVATLQKHEQVKEAKVMAQPGPDGTDRLVAYILPEQRANEFNSADWARELRPFMSTLLPPSMLPDIFIPITEWPRTPSGKVNLHNLPKCGVVLTVAAPPASSIESDILNIWKSILEVDDIGVRDNFFEVGGTSLLIVSVHEQLQRLLRHQFSLTTLFQNPTVESMAAWLGNDNQSAPYPYPTPRRIGQKEQGQKRRNARMIRSA